MAHALLSASLATDYLMDAINHPELIRKLTNRYYAKRKLYASAFLFLTNISFTLINNKNKFLGFFVAKCPALAAFLPRLICRYYPLVGAVKKIKSSDDEVDGLTFKKIKAI